MTDKVQIIQKNTFDVIKSALNKAVELVKPTFGPAGNKVIISKITHGFVVDDGVQIMRDLELPDPAENSILKVIRETAIRTNDRVGDGTTGAMIILQSLVEEIAKNPNADKRKVTKELKNGFEEAKKQLLAMSKTITTKEELYKIAKVSFDNEEISELVADSWFKLGVNGVLTFDRSSTMETFVELTEGITINRGYISPYMITNPQRMEAVIEKPYILLTDYRLTEVNDVLGIMNKLAEKQITNLIIIAENIEQNALATLVVNKLQGKFTTIAINSPAGEDKIVQMEDIAMMTGAKLFSEKKGDKLEEVEIEDLGRAERFIAKRAESVIIGPKGDVREVKKAILDLKRAADQTKVEKEKQEIKKRIARLNNKVGVIKVGAPTENEVNALKYKVEDAINAVHSAFRGGVVPGAGTAFTKIKTSSEILNNALQAPFRQIRNNMGIGNVELGKNQSINAITGEIGDWQKIGIMDPVEVLIAQIESAVSIASLLITTSGMIVERPQHIKEA